MVMSLNETIHKGRKYEVLGLILCMRSSYMLQNNLMSAKSDLYLRQQSNVSNEVLIEKLRTEYNKGNTNESNKLRSTK